jgi:anaerobic selenocysteine-containing dehydrogenase
VFRDHDALTGSRRDEVFMYGQDARRLNVEPGEAVILESPLGKMNARVRIEPVQSGTLQVFWPEANGLIARYYDTASGEPDYNAQVSVRKL